MNIKSAKEQIKNAITAYFTKDEFGNYVIPIERQRPVFLMGPPGIGKTAIMEQIANEMGVGLLSYSMTHHTRQSALGLPFIVHKTYGDQEFDVSEYTMSEIISSVYDLMERTGLKEGILFLDEINCVSETLSPIMLQFLQYKVFGRHRVPDGWIVVTAGNPPEYNNSVREFDIVTWDRLKRVDCEPDYSVWKEYAVNAGVHPSITTYLDIKKADFYLVETTTDGKSFVTARGWEDLSKMIILYEQNGIKVDEELVSQYLQNKKIAKSFAQYYDLFQKYKSDYQVGDILAGKASDEIKNRAKKARFDERLSLIGLMLDAVGGEAKTTMLQTKTIDALLKHLQSFKMQLTHENEPVGVLTSISQDISRQIQEGRIANNLSEDDRRIRQALIKILDEEASLVGSESDAKNAFAIVKKDFGNRVKALGKQAEETKTMLNNMFMFSEEVFTEGQELLIIVTELTTNLNTASFISRYGCEAYFKNNKDLLFYERNMEIEEAIKELEID